jgi:hypothetical protein
LARHFPLLDASSDTEAAGGQAGIDVATLDTDAEPGLPL